MHKVTNKLNLTTKEVQFLELLLNLTVKQKSPWGSRVEEYKVFDTRTNAFYSAGFNTLDKETLCKFSKIKPASFSQFFNALLKKEAIKEVLDIRNRDVFMVNPSIYRHYPCVYEEYLGGWTWNLGSYKAAWHYVCSATINSDEWHCPFTMTKEEAPPRVLKGCLDWWELNDSHEETAPVWETHHCMKRSPAATPAIAASTGGDFYSSLGHGY